jgi:hypothetical protein
MDFFGCKVEEKTNWSKIILFVGIAVFIILALILFIIGVFSPKIF